MTVTGYGAQSVLGPQQAHFLGASCLSILAASRGPDNIPSVARSLGCRFSPDFSSVTLFFCPAEAQELIDHIAANKTIAVVFSVPATHEALQLKAMDAVAGKPLPGDADLVAAYRQAFTNHVEKLGFSRQAIEMMLACDCDSLITITFTPVAAFSQTPGPKAGHAIGAGR